MCTLGLPFGSALKRERLKISIMMVMVISWFSVVTEGVYFLTLWCTAKWQVQGTHSNSKSSITLTTLIHQHSIDHKRSHHKGYAFITRASVAFKLGKNNYLRWFLVAFLSDCVSRLLQNTCSFRLAYSQFAGTNTANLIQFISNM